MVQTGVGVARLQLAVQSDQIEEPAAPLTARGDVLALGIDVLLSSAREKKRHITHQPQIGQNNPEGVRYTTYIGEGQGRLLAFVDARIDLLDDVVEDLGVARARGG